MVEGRRKDWRELESLGDAARRLLQELDARKKRKTRAGGGEAPEQIRPEARRNARQDAPQASGFTPPGEDGGDHVAEGVAGNGLDGWRGCAFCDAAMRPPAQPCAGSDSDGFTVEAQFEEEARNVRAVDD